MKNLIDSTSNQEQFMKMKKENAALKKELQIHRAMVHWLETSTCMGDVRCDVESHLREGQGRKYCDKDMCLLDCEHPRNAASLESRSGSS
jgi:hypothetical protein